MVLSAHRRRDRPRTARLMVLLDGEPRPHAFYADGRRGVVREYVHPLQWQPGVGIKKRELRGKVTWKWIA